MLTYKGFIAQLEYEPETDCILGEVVNAKDVLIFEGQNLEQLKQHFARVIDEYLALEEERLDVSVSPFVGRFTVCLSSQEQQKLLHAAGKEAISVHHWLSRELQLVINKINY